MMRIAPAYTPDDHDIMVWREADGWMWGVIRVRNGRDDVVVAAGGPEKTEDAAWAAADAAKPREHP